MTLTAGATLGPYRILEQVGRGGMATVYKAYQASLARNVAIKVLPAFFAEDAGFRERFQQEAISVAKLRHPNILAVFDYGEEAGITYIVSEFIDGGTLAEQIGTPLPPDYAARVLGPIASAIDYAHARGVLHRDIKPSNILVASDGTPILSDFGLAKMVGSMPRLTQTGTTVGTPEYMAPEQAMGDVMGPSSDLYSLAVVAYELLTGRVPFTAETPLAVLLAHAHKPLPLPRTVNPSLPPEVEAVLLKGLAKSPADRYASASDLIRGLEEAARGVAQAGPAAGVTSVPAATATQTAPSAAPSPSLRVPGVPARILLGAGLLLVLLAGAALALSARPSEERGVQPSPEATLPVEVAATEEAPTPTVEPTPTPTPTPLAEVRGDLIVDVLLDEDETAIATTNVHPDDSAAEVIARDGELELRVLKGDDQVQATFIDEHPETYVAELDVRFSNSARVELTWMLDSPRRAFDHPVIGISAADDAVYMAFIEFTGNIGEIRELGPTVRVPGLRTGRAVTVGIAITGSTYVLYVDGVEVMRAQDERVAVGSPGLSLISLGGTGSAFVTGLRYYEYIGE